MTNCLSGPKLEKSNAKHNASIFDPNSSTRITWFCFHTFFIKPLILSPVLEKIRILTIISSRILQFREVETQEGARPFVAHVPVPSQQDVEDALLRRKKRELLEQYASESLQAQSAEARTLMGLWIDERSQLLRYMSLRQPHFSGSNRYDEL